MSRIGLLGGSFNPAHAGHLYISDQARSLLGLDAVWWLVSPQNPLKETQGMAPLDIRIKQAEELVDKYPYIIISDFEKYTGTVYTYDTIIALKRAHAQHHFVWLMGADNLLELPKWYKWRDIMREVPVAVFNRGDLREKALSGEVARIFAANKLSVMTELPCEAPPAWVFLDIKTHPASSTGIR